MIANRWNFNICFHVWGSFHLVFAVRAPKKRCDYFWPVFWPENAFSPFSYTGGLLVCKNEKLNCFDIQSVVEASSFRLNHNVTLESKENYPRHTKIVQNSLGFMPEVKPLHKPRGDLVLCAHKGGTTLNKPPIGLHVKILNFNGRFEAFSARYGMFLFHQPIQNRWKFNICFNVWVVFRLVFTVRACKQRPLCFWPVFKPQNVIPTSSHYTGLLS